MAAAGGSIGQGSRPAIAFTLLTCAWGSSFFFTALALESFTPFLIVYLRIAVGAVLLGVAVAVLRLRFPPWGRVYIHFLVLGLISIALPFALITEAQVRVSSSMTAILVSTTPLFVFLIAWAHRYTEKVTLWKIAGLVLSFLGVLALYGFQQGLHLASDGWPLVVLMCAVLFAAANIYTRLFVIDTNPVVLAFLQTSAGLLVFTASAVFLAKMPANPPSLMSILAVLQLGAVSSAVAYVMLAYLIQTWGSMAASVNTYLQPVVGLSLGVLVLGEELTAGAWASLALIFTGIIIFGVDAARAVMKTFRLK